MGVRLFHRSTRSLSLTEEGPRYLESVQPQHLSDSLSLHLYYGSRVAQPARVRRFIDIAVERLSDSPAFVLTPAELAQAHARGVAGHTTGR